MLETGDSKSAHDFFFERDSRQAKRALSIVRGYDPPMCHLPHALPHAATVLRLVGLRACTLGTTDQQAGKTGQYCPGLASDH